MVGADVPHANVVAHDEEDVRLLAIGLGLGGGRFAVRVRRATNCSLFMPSEQQAAAVSWSSLPPCPGSGGSGPPRLWVKVLILARRGQVTGRTPTASTEAICSLVLRNIDLPCHSKNREQNNPLVTESVNEIFYAAEANMRHAGVRRAAVPRGPADSANSTTD